MVPSATVETRLRRPVGILFAEDFDLPPQGSSPARRIVEAHGSPCQPPRGLAVRSTDTEAPDAQEPDAEAPDTEAIRREAFAAGYAMAKTHADARATEHMAAAQRLLGEISTALHDTAQESARISEAGAEAIARLLLGLLATALPALCAHHGAAEIAGLVRGILPALAHAPQVVVRVSPHTIDALRGEIDRLDAEFRSRIVVTPTDAVAPGDVRVVWQDGQASRDTARLWQEIAGVLAPIGLMDILEPRDVTI